MAALSPATFTLTRTGGAGIGYREDFSKDALTLLDPHDSYFTKKCAREVARALNHDWLTDNLPALSALPTPRYLSQEPSYATTVARKRYCNVIQYFSYVWQIVQASEIIAQKSGVAGGITSEIANEIERQMKYAGKEMEAVFLSAQAAVNDDGTTTGGKLSGFFEPTIWNGHSTDTVPLAWNAKVAATKAEFLGFGQADVEDVLLTAYQNGAIGPFSAYMPSYTQANWAATFQGRPGYQVQQAVGEHMIDNQVYTYFSRTGIGQVDFIADRTIDPQYAVAFVNHDYMKIAELNPISVYENDPNTFRNRQGWIDCYATLMDKNPQAHIRLYTTGVTWS